LVAIEGRPCRQDLSRQLGVPRVLAPEQARDSITVFGDGQAATSGADLIYEVSGHPEALNLAVHLSGFASRIVIGSWYGSKPVAVELGGAAHRNRLQLITSQVSTLAPALSGRWDKQRRFELAWEMLRQVDPRQLVTQVLPLQEADSLYRQLHEEQPGILQPLFHYPE
ncbi:MAG: hypothetical protein KDI29_08800, partial [Pseudomonadales bacterium]|nr:hypothetical protein [Pseudomonadales bacterium]